MSDFLSAVAEATDAMRDLFPETPLQENVFLSQKTGARVFLKREDLSPVRSYKIRGAFTFFRKALARAGDNAAFVCASAGNHAQGFAFVCRHFGRKGVVFMPVTTPQQKIDKTRLFGGAFVETDRVLGVFRGWNAAMVEASYGIFQVAAGPSFDAGITCGVSTGQGGGLDACDAVIAPGLATRAGIRIGILALSGDVHVTFDEHMGPDVWVLAGLGIQLGDVASGPMLFPSTDPLDREPEDADAPMTEHEAPPIETVQRPMIARTGEPPAGEWGRWLDEPSDPFGTDAEWAASREPEPEPVATFEPARAPVVRRFSARDVRTRSAPTTAASREAPPEMPELSDTLDAEASDDPIDGLEGY